MSSARGKTKIDLTNCVNLHACLVKMRRLDKFNPIARNFTSPILNKCFYVNYSKYLNTFNESF